MQVLFAILVAVGWLYFFLSDSTWLVALLVLIPATAVAIYKVRRYQAASMAAHNVVAAAATFGGLSPADQSRIHDHAIAIIKRSGWQGSRAPSLDDDVVRYGWYALALAELGMKPVCLIQRWSLVRNPFREALNPEYYIRSSEQMAAKEGYVVSLNRAPPPTRETAA